MPRPEKLTEEQEWFLSLLDLKFKEHEARMRGLLNLRPQDEHQLHLNELQLNPVDHDPSSNGNVLNEMDAIEAEKLADVEEDPEESKTPSKLTRSGSNRVTKFGSSYVMSEIDQPDPPIKSFVKGPLDLWMAMVVIINLTMMAAATQSTGHSADVALGLASGSTWGLTEQGFETAELIFYFIYVTDVLVRMCILRSEWYFDNREGWMYMNFFDLLLVSVHTFEIVLLPVLASGDSDQRASTIRVIKLLRVVRTLRIVKTVALFRQLRLLVATCVASIGALFWSMVLLFMLKIGFALVMAQALQGFVLDDNANMDTRLEVNNLYGSFSKALYTTFEITHSGSWPSRVRPVIEKVSPWYSIPFLAYITLVVFAVIRIVTALFLKETLASAANDADMQMDELRGKSKDYQRKLEELFRAADTDDNGTLSATEFVEAMSLPSVQHYMQVLEVKIQDCRPLFDILDDGDGRITIPEFCKGLMQLKGQARALDIVMLQRENKKVLLECQEISRMLYQWISNK